MISQNSFMIDVVSCVCASWACGVVVGTVGLLAALRAGSSLYRSGCNLWIVLCCACCRALEKYVNY